MNELKFRLYKPIKEPDKRFQNFKIHPELKKGEIYPDLKPGDIVLLKGSRECKLVGHVNKNLGVCDDCKGFEEKDILAVASIFDLITVPKTYKKKIK